MAIGEGIHDLDEATYHADPCPEPSLSSSIAKLLVGRSPRHAWLAHPRLNPQPHESNESKFDLGSAFHTLMLGKGAEIEPIDAADWRTKAAKDARDAARAAGKIPMLASQATRALRMRDLVSAQIAEHEEARPALEAGTPERTIVWREDNGIWCRALLDWMPETGSAYPDLKTTDAGADPEGWGRVMFNVGCDIQDAFYRRGLQKLGICPQPYLLFVVAETDEPHLIATHRCGLAAAAIADRKVESAIRLWKHCLEGNRWPGYSRATAWQEPPVWLEEQWLDREIRIDQFLQGAA